MRREDAECAERKGNDDSLRLCASALKNNYDFRELIPAVEKGETEISRNISNCDRSVGTALSGWLVANKSQLTVNFNGVAGQSFGAFLARGVTFNLVGEANDYIGKGISGGIITIRPPKSDIVPEGNVIAGNVIAYGGTSGAIFLNGQAGERFGIRNSGATLVVEGVGDHGCEYMTGGVAYVYDESAVLDLNCNLDSVDIFPVEPGSDDEKALLAILEEHVRRTGSPKASRLLADWTNQRPRFAKVSPALSS